MTKQRISYVDPATMPEEMRVVVERSAREGTPRPESQCIRAHAPGAFWAFENSWQAVFRTGVCEHAIKELCRVYVSASVKCEYCGNQRSVRAAKSGLVEQDYKDLLNFMASSRFDARQKAALSLAEAITWDLPADDALWDALHRHFSEPEIVELGCFIALTMGQQRFLRTLNIDHHRVLAGTAASMAPGLETREAYEQAKQSPDYWARQDVVISRKDRPAAE